MAPPTPILAVFLKIIVWSYAIAELRILEHPQNASVYNGQTHTLNCKFNEHVNCAWYLEDIPVVIDLRYRYTSNYGVNTMQCSIEISNFSDRDTKRWQCKNKVVKANANVTKSKEAFLSIKNPELVKQVTILMNEKPISKLEVSTDAWTNLTCIVESIGPIQSLQWNLDGRIIPNDEFSSNCSTRNTFQQCYSWLQWPGGEPPPNNSTHLSCFTEGNFTYTVELYRNALLGNDSAVLDILENPDFISDTSSTTKIVFFSMLATASFVLVLVTVVSVVACYRQRSKCRDPDPGLFQSSDELRHRCSSVLRLSQQEAMSRQYLSIQNPVYTSGSSTLRQKTPQNYVLLPDRHSRYSEAEAFPSAPSYIELSSCLPFHACDCPCHLDLINLNYCTGNCNSHAQTTYIPRPMMVDGDFEARGVDSEELYTDGQSTSDAQQVNISCPDVSAADRQFSQESLYNDCIPTSSRS